MEALIAAMRRPAAASAPERTTVTDDRVAVAAWRAIHDPSASTSGAPAVRARPLCLEHGTRVGRYVVLRPLGSGGMGVVHAAYDPELDRTVALKLVHPRRVGEEHQRRLLREAQALAKLSHRHVVTVFDVGTMGEHVWMVMELVRGQTMRQWLRTHRSWREVLAVLLPAGRGLAAAHAAGLVHRDFKPDNVMIAEDGDARVMDFDLAYPLTTVATPEPDASHDATGPTLDLRAAQVTEPDVLVGTPGYMAPEQLLGQELGPAVDQFALCVTLWEALYGERPFAGRSFEEQAEALVEGRLRRPPRGRSVPPWLRRACERGLCVEPRDRFASMAALLAALAHGRARARWRMGAAAVGVLAAGVAGVGAWRQLDVAQRIAACEATGAEIEEVWNDDHRQALRTAILATEQSYAPATAERVMPWLDRQATAWREARVEACLDADVRGRWDAKLLNASLWCLDERRMELASMVEALTVVDPTVVRGAVTAASKLAAVAPCRDEDVLRAMGSPTDEPREAVSAVRADVARVSAMVRAGRFEQGTELARQALARAEALGWRPLVATARYWLGIALVEAGEGPAAEAALEDAYFEAADGVAPDVAFDASHQLTVLVGNDLARLAEGMRWSRHGEVALTSVHDAPGLRRAALLSGRGVVELRRGAHEHAIASMSEALAVLEAALGRDDLGLATPLSNLGSAESQLGAFESARAHHERALSIVEEGLGPEHPRVAGVLNNLALVHGRLGDYAQAKRLQARGLEILERAEGPQSYRLVAVLTNLAGAHEATGEYDEAEALYERALQVTEASLGPKHQAIPTILNNHGLVLMATGRVAEAKARFERALAIQEPTLDPLHPDLGMSVLNLGFAQQQLGELQAARVSYERARAIYEASLGPTHPHVGRCLGNLGDLHLVAGELEEARALYERALAIGEAALGVEHQDLALALLGLASVALEQQRWADAAPLAERAVQLRARDAPPEHLAQARFVLARALWDAPVVGGGDRTRALALAEQARVAYRAAGAREATALGAVEQWLRERTDDP